MTPRSFRQRYPGPWCIECTEGGFQVRSGSTTLCWIYVYSRTWESLATTGQLKLTPVEGLALAEVVASLGGKSGRTAMSEIDRQRIAAVRTLEALGYDFRAGRWHAPAHSRAQQRSWAEADALHHLLVERADALIGCTDGSADQDDLEAIGEAIEAYESIRWPDGKIDGGKG